MGQHRASRPCPAHRTCVRFLTGTVIAIHREMVWLPLFRGIARDVGDCQCLLSRTHPIILVQFEFFFLYLKIHIINWQFLCITCQALCCSSSITCTTLSLALPGGLGPQDQASLFLTDGAGVPCA
jgi:hypothetical protein